MPYADILGTIPQWITATGMVSFLGLVLRHWQVMKRLALGDTADIRDHYAQELERYANEVARVTERQLECEKRETVLRDRVRALEDEVTGLHRKLANKSSDNALMIGDPTRSAPLAAASAERVKKITNGDKGE